MHCTKIATPYGIRLNWQLPGAGQATPSGGMNFSVHLKDNVKVAAARRRMAMPFAFGRTNACG